MGGWAYPYKDMATEKAVPHVLFIPSGAFVLEEGWPFLSNQGPIEIVIVLKPGDDAGGLVSNCHEG